MGNIETLTKNTYTQCQALNMAFFMPKINQAWLNLTASLPDLSLKNRNRIAKYGRVKARIKDLAIGKKCNRVSAISDTRPPEIKTGGPLTSNTYGGQAMPLNTSHAQKLEQFSFTINLPKNSFIKRFVAMYMADYWVLAVETESKQTALIQDINKRTAREFKTLDELALWLAGQGVGEMSVFLTEHLQTQAVNSLFSEDEFISVYKGDSLEQPIWHLKQDNAIAQAMKWDYPYLHAAKISKDLIKSYSQDQQTVSLNKLPISIATVELEKIEGAQ